MKKTILLVDNEIDVQNRYFLQAEYDVLVAHDGKEGLELFRKKSIDLIITDIMMPNMNGYEATRAIRSLSREDARTIPIVAMSANAFTEDKVRCREAGMDGHLTKPIDSDKLIDALAKIMAAKEG